MPHGLLWIQKVLSASIWLLHCCQWSRKPLKKVQSHMRSKLWRPWKSLQGLFGLAGRGSFFGTLACCVSSNAFFKGLYTLFAKGASMSCSSALPALPLQGSPPQRIPQKRFPCGHLLFPKGLVLCCLLPKVFHWRLQQVWDAFLFSKTLRLLSKALQQAVFCQICLLASSCCLGQWPFGAPGSALEEGC